MSHQAFGLDRLDAEKIIFFQEITDKDIQIADEFGYRAIGSETNIGIAQGYKRLVEESTNDLFLFLENDWALLDDPAMMMYEAAEMLRQKIVDVVRFRHRVFPGHPLYTRQFEGHELEHPTHLLDSIHWTTPEKFDQIEKVGDWWITTSQYANWTNNPTMFRTKWLRENIFPRIGSKDIEVDLQSWWETQEFKVAQGWGLFTHNRIG